MGHLMTALFRSSRQAEALKMYECTRSYLVEEFGVDTSADLQQLHTALLRQELGSQCAPGMPGDPVPPGAAAAPRQVGTTMSGTAPRPRPNRPCASRRCRTIGSTGGPTVPPSPYPHRMNLRFPLD